jgi:16S rRNA C967 or C1407 C5-methylase (RsmB/RsmF family)/NOL1/NOP2/fmu family ribosome biogenesis protein
VRRDATRTELPQAYLQRMERLLGNEYPSFLASYDRPPVSGLRANTLKVSPKRLQSLAPFELSPVAWPPGAFVVGDEAQPGLHPYHAAGLYYLQEPSAMAVAELLGARAGERVLDLAAAPGGKATQIATMMDNQGLLVANEIHPRRVWDLSENLERWGARQVAITAETSERLAERFAGFFDRVLLDAPCSGEGMFRKSDVARREWAPELVQGCATRQAAILERAAQMVRPGGLIAYSTCTFAAEEDEGSIARFLQSHADFELVDAMRRPGFAEGRPDWLAGELALPALKRTVRLWPHLWQGEGHFVALLRRAEAGPAEAPRPWRLPRLPAAAFRLYHAFCQDNLTRMPAEDRLTVTGTYLYQIPPDLPDLSGLRFIHPGWWLGTLKTDRFEPSHALAMALDADDVRRKADLPAVGMDVQAYLRGETVRSEGDDGWVLVTVDGFALGWGKRVRGILKSHYPRGLRRR